MPRRRGADSSRRRSCEAARISRYARPPRARPMTMLERSARPHRQLAMAKAARAQPSKVATAMARRTYLPAARASASSRSCWGVSWIAKGEMADINRIIDPFGGRVADGKKPSFAAVRGRIIEPNRLGKLEQDLGEIARCTRCL